jgi:hypothetical protein
MFTNEFEYDHTVTTVLDPDGGFEDVELVIDDAGCFIRQYNEVENNMDLIVMSHKMLNLILIAMKTKEGVFTVDYVSNKSQSETK